MCFNSNSSSAFPLVKIRSLSKCLIPYIYKKVQFASIHSKSLDSDPFSRWDRKWLVILFLVGVNIPPPRGNLAANLLPLLLVLVPPRWLGLFNLTFPKDSTLFVPEPDTCQLSFSPEALSPHQCPCVKYLSQRLP